MRKTERKIIGAAKADPKHCRLLVFVQQAGVADMIGQHTPFRVSHVGSFKEALTAVQSGSYSALLACSPMSESGSAFEVIRAFRVKCPDGVCIYHGWDYRIELSGVKAERCGADFLLVGATLGHELFNFLHFAVQAKRQGTIPTPPTLQWYESTLRRFFPRSPFWEIAEQFRSEGRSPSEYE